MALERLALCAALLSLAACAGTAPVQVPITSRAVPLIQADGFTFRDLDRDGALTTFEDWRLTPAERAADLLARMTLAEKAGQLIVPSLNPSAPMGQAASGHDLTALAQQFNHDRATHFNARLSADPRTLAQANNAAQELAEGGRLAIPITLSTNSRHGFTELVGASLGGGTFSAWPNSLGFAALGDAELVRQQAALVARDLRATGFGVLLGPQIDLATEPRWPRSYETYGEDAALSARLAAAFVTGLQGSARGVQRGGVTAVIKHFAGYSAAVDGFDAHNRYGRFSHLSGAEFAQHIRPFAGAIDAQAAGVMPAYSILRGLELDGAQLDQRGVGFSHEILSGVLRGQLGFDGFILSDWGIINDCGDICMNGFPAGQRPNFSGISMAWGVEQLTMAQRVGLAMGAGMNQFGGLESAQPILDAVAQGLVTQEQIDDSVRRVVTADLALGLFENPFVDPESASRLTTSAADIAWGEAVQARSAVLLESDRSMGIAPGTRVYLSGFDPAVARSVGLVPVDDPGNAQVAILRTAAAFETLHPQYMFGSMHQEGSLAFARLLSGELAPEGRLPFELPSSMAAVEAQRSGAAADSADPLYPVGYQLDPQLSNRR